VVVFSGGEGGSDGFREVAFSKSNVVIATSALGVHRIDPKTGSDRILIPLDRYHEQEQLVAAGGAAALYWREYSPAPGTPLVDHVDLIDVDAGTVKPLTVSGTASLTLSADGALLLWQSTAPGRSIVFDTKSGATLQTFDEAAPSNDGSLAKFSPSGRFVLVGGVLRVVETGRVVWRRPGGDSYYRRGVDFTTALGHEALIYPGTKLLQLVNVDDGTVTEADVDCLKGEMPSRELVAQPASAFVRFCSRGVLYTDLVALNGWHGNKPLPPVRVRDGRRMQLTANGKLLFFTGAQQTGWLQYDPRASKPTKVPAPPEEADAQAGNFVVTRGPHRGCEIRAKDAPPSTSTGEATELSSSWLCSAKLSADGAMFSQNDDGALTIGEVPSLRTLFAIGDSRRRLDESVQTTVVVLGGKLLVRSRGYRGSQSTENEFSIERTLSIRKDDFTPIVDDKLATLTEAQRVHVREQLPGDPRESCHVLGALPLAHALLVGCTENASDVFYHFDATSFALLPGVRKGRSWSDVREPIAREPGAEPSYDDGYGLIDDDVAIQPGDSTRGLRLTEIRHAQSHEILAQLHVGWDFAIADDFVGHVQVFGNRKRAATWLRCREADGTMLPFEACAATAEAKIY
jgi:hypothetical protein